MKNYYCVRDLKANAGLDPFLSDNDETAKRSVVELCRSQPSHTVCRYAQDYMLFRVGSWDPVEMRMVGEPPFEVSHVIHLRALASEEEVVEEPLLRMAEGE